jgi:hypothetical protein
MGSSCHDLRIKVIVGEKTAYFTGVKGIDHLLWNFETGLYGTRDIVPDPARVFDFALSKKAFAKGDWQITEWGSEIPSSEYGIYGEVTFDWNRQEIRDAQHFHTYYMSGSIENMIDLLYGLRNHTEKGLPLLEGLALLDGVDPNTVHCENPSKKIYSAYYITPYSLARFVEMGALSAINRRSFRQWQRQGIKDNSPITPVSSLSDLVQIMALCVENEGGGSLSDAPNAFLLHVEKMGFAFKVCNT